MNRPGTIVRVHVPSPEGEGQEEGMENRRDDETGRVGGAGVEGMLVTVEGGLVVRGAEESMKGRGDEVEA